MPWPLLKYPNLYAKKFWEKQRAQRGWQRLAVLGEPSDAGPFARDTTLSGFHR
jgi:hypothetical protein